MSTNNKKKISTVDKGNSNDGSAETISDGGQDTAPDTTSNAVSEDSSTNEASSEEQATLVDEASTASNDDEVGTTSDGEQSGVSDQTSNTITATDEEEDPLHIYYDKNGNGKYEGGDRISSEDKAANLGDVCQGQTLEITVLVEWEIEGRPPNSVNVEMIELTSFGITFNPTTFTLSRPSPTNQSVTVTIPSLSLGTWHVVIKANNTGQDPPKGRGISEVAGTEGHFKVNVISCVPQADLSISKSGPAYAHAGDTITYTYTVSNAGPDAACNVVVSDDVAGPATYVSGDNDGDDCLDPGETWTFQATYTVQAGDPDPLVNTATVSSDADDPNTSNNVATWSVDILHPAIDVSKSCPQYAHEGDTISYTITVKNAGDTPLSNVMVSDPLLGFSWTGSLAVGEEKTFTASFTVPMPSGDITNTVTASGQDPLGLTVSDTAQCTVDILHPAIAIDKSADRSQAHAGDTITYTIIVTNTGDTRYTM
jgi:uncharacterized repeat protein (TIGR01451 family)